MLRWLFEEDEIMPCPTGYEVLVAAVIVFVVGMVIGGIFLGGD